MPLQKLDVSHNQIATLPATISVMTSLQTLAINDNKIVVSLIINAILVGVFSRCASLWPTIARYAPMTLELRFSFARERIQSSVLLLMTLLCTYLSQSVYLHSTDRGLRYRS